MPVATSPETVAAAESPATPGRPPAAALTRGVRLRMVALGLVPPAQVALVVAAGLAPGSGAGPWTRAAAALAALYLVPPLLVRAALAAAPVSPGDHPAGSPPFLRWWFLSQCQSVFNRLPFLEEALRLIPGLYAAWLRLWGARVGRLVYWAPGMRILDRPFLEVGDRAVFGAGVRVNPHVVVRDAEGRWTLQMGPVRVGADALVGGYALLTAGSRVGDGETLPALQVLPPFSVWEGGRRVKPGGERVDDGIAG